MAPFKHSHIKTRAGTIDLLTDDTRLRPVKAIIFDWDLHRAVIRGARLRRSRDGTAMTIPRKTAPMINVRVSELVVLTWS